MLEIGKNGKISKISPKKYEIINIKIKIKNTMKIEQN